MSILDDDSFEEYFDSTAGSAHAGSECTAAKGRYDSCFFKSYNERYRVGEVRMDECKSLFNEYKDCVNKTVNNPARERERSGVGVPATAKRITDPDEAWKRMTSSK